MRVDSWEEKLNAYVEEARTKPFQWGEQDCCMFSANWVRILTGEKIDPAAGLRGRYKTERGAGLIIKRNGGSLEKVIERALETSDVKETPIGFARRGDLMLWEQKDNSGFTVGICLGAKSAFVNANGIEFTDTLACVKAWRI